MVPGRGVLAPLGIDDVVIGPGFWGDRQRLNGEVILDHCRGWMERLGWIGNFRAAANGRLPAGRRGREFSDADVYKLIEAMCWEAGRTGRKDVEAAIADLSQAIAAAQHADGYLNTRFGHLEVTGRYRDLEWGHELYCIGHLVQAAVARLRTGGDRDDVLVTVARRAADHVCREFGPGGRQGVDGHPEIETALVELYRATGEQRYLDTARRFVERRGRPALADIELGRAYFQDDQPLRSARALRGHAVRALYLACGAADVAVETGDRDLLERVAEQWRHTLAARTYLTGGMGSRHDGEAFGEDYELPPDRAYAETCAGVAAVMLAWRLLLATGEAHHADAAERILFNVVATAVRHDGRAFFYCNPLQARVPPPEPDPAVECPRPEAGLRAPWFSVACCPPNVARLLASLSGYVATASPAGGRPGDPSAVQLHQLVPGTVGARLAGSGSVRLRLQTDYPWSGGVTVRIEDCPATPWRLDIRMPAWAGEMQLTLGDAAAPNEADGTGSATAAARAGGSRAVTRSQVAGTRGYATIERPWRAGDELRLELPVRPRRTYPDPRVDAVRGCVAVERGPLVYCAESQSGEPATATPTSSAPADAADSLASVTVDPASIPVDLGADEALGGAVTVGVTARDRSAPANDDSAYRASPPATGDAAPRTLALIPYHLWGNRGPATMRVWLPTV